MKLLRAIPLLLLALTVVQAQDNAKPTATGLNVAEFTLDNGLTLLVCERKGVPVVSTYVWYNVGSKDEQPGVTGVAHFLEHMMFKGSRNYKVGDVDKITVRNGGSNNAFTSFDYTAYFIDLPRSRCEEALKIEADRMAHLTLAQKEFDAEKKVVQSESDISADDPNDRLWERMNLELFGHGHEYAHPILGFPQDVADTTRRDMRLFYEQYYTPNNAVLVMVGDITPKDALAMTKKHFDDIPRGPDLMRSTTTQTPLAKTSEFEIKSDSPMIQMARAYTGVSSGHDDEAALDMAGEILGGGVTSRLYRTLVEDKRLAVYAGGSIDSRKLGGGFDIWAGLAPGKEREDLVAAIDSVVEDFVTNGVTQAELDRVRNRYLAQIAFGRESASSIGSALGRSHIVDGSYKATLEYPSKLKRVTREQVIEAAKKYLHKRHHVTGWLVPELKPETTATAEDFKPSALPAKRTVLDNGLTVITLQRVGTPVVTARLWARNGSSGETVQNKGIASFTGSLLDTGTQAYSKQELAEALETVGAQLSVGQSGATIKVTSDQLAFGIDTLAEVVQRPTFPETEVKLAKTQILASLENAKNDVGTFARQAGYAWLYGGDTAFGYPSDGTTDTVKSLTRDDAIAWHRRYFRPENSVLVVVGDFDPATLNARVNSAFAKWEKAEKPTHPKRTWLRRENLKGTQRIEWQDFDVSKIDPEAKRILINHPKKDQCSVRLVGLGIARDNPDYFPLLVMDNILGTSPGFTDRFSKVLRDQMGLAYSTWANISNGAGYYQGGFVAYIGTRPENVETSIAKMYELLADIRNKPVSDEEIRNAKDYLKGSFVFDMETSGQLAGLLLDIERFGLGFDYPATYAQSVDQVTKEDIQRVAKKYLVPDSMVEVIAGPVDKITPAKKEK